MIYNEKEYGFVYTVGAKCDIDQMLIDGGTREFQQYLEKHGEVALTIMLATALSKAYADVNGGDALTEKIIRTMPMDIYTELDSEVFKALTEGQKRTVEAKPSKKPASTK